MRIRYPGRWPLPVAECDCAPPADYPVGFDLATVVRWLWRVRRWRYDFNVSLAQGGTATWTHDDSHNPPPVVRSGAAQIQATVARAFTLPDPDTDPRADESSLLSRNVDSGDGGWGLRYEEDAGFDAKIIGLRDSAHPDPNVTGSSSYPYPNPNHPLAVRYRLMSLWQDAYFPYPPAEPADPVPVMYHSRGTGLYYPRLLLYLFATVTSGPTRPGDATDQGAAVALATPGALQVALPGDAAPRGALLPDWQASAFTAVYPNRLNCRVFIDGTELPASVFVRAGYAMAASVSTVKQSVGNTVQDTYAGQFGEPTLSMTLDLSPAEYWPYDDRHGTPLYNTMTGEVVLCDPDGVPVDPVLAPYP